MITMSSSIPRNQLKHEKINQKKLREINSKRSPFIFPQKSLLHFCSHERTKTVSPLAAFRFAQKQSEIDENSVRPFRASWEISRRHLDKLVTRKTPSADKTMKLACNQCSLRPWRIDSLSGDFARCARVEAKAIWVRGCLAES